MPPPHWLDSGNYPFVPRWRPLKLGRMYYVDQGEGRPVVMVHGNPTWSFLYRNLIKSLSPTCRCIAPDHIGFGLSDKPTGWSYLPRDHARNLSALIDHLELENFILVVQDWGGPMGLSYAIEHPENVRALIILNTWMWPVDRDLRFAAFSTLAGSQMGKCGIMRLNVFLRLLLPLWFGDTGKLTPEVYRHYLRPLSRPDARKGMWVFPREIVGSAFWLKELWDGRTRLKGIPKLIVWGTEDVAFRGEELRRWMKAFPRARVVKIAGAGHFVQEEAPGTLGLAVEQFLRGIEHA